ncbi:MAG: ATP-binding cassette domain-containing protein [Geminicoccaceae bacterium]|nr:ATP-binding cassette domain-containing protein [Geminicoccaceae bacterium]
MALSQPLISIRSAALNLGGRQILDGIDLDIQREDRVCLVGRNGAGKSSLMRVMAGRVELDSGSRTLGNRALVSYLPQEPEIPAGMKLCEVVLDGLPALQRDESNLYRARDLLESFEMDSGRDSTRLSGGEQRRVSLARALVSSPDVLLLDEPTNHLDLPAIEWLEARLREFAGAIVLVSHDRRFLSAIGNATWWLDRGTIRVNRQGYDHFEDWRDELLQAEERELERLAQKIRAEQHWLHRGVTARRRRNQGRLGRLGELRAARGKLLRGNRGVALRAEHREGGGALVIEARDLVRSFGDHRIVDGFSTRIMRQDRVGFIGRNGTGKTTLLRLLLGELEPDSGDVRMGTNLVIARFDQHRSELDESLTPWQLLCPDGGDKVVLAGGSRHVVGYLGDFLFRDEQVRTPIRALSGGERSRLLLAKILAQPSNLLVLDEPTNDLDIETLEILEEMLADYRGTVLIVSHDRAFLDAVVTSTVVLDGSGRVEEFAGGFSDWLAQRSIPAEADRQRGKAPPAAIAKEGAAPVPRARIDRKLERELERLPGRIEALSLRIGEDEARLLDPELYNRDPDGFLALSREIEERKAELDELETRWLELEEQRETMERG